MTDTTSGAERERVSALARELWSLSWQYSREEGIERMTEALAAALPAAQATGDNLAPVDRALADRLAKALAMAQPGLDLLGSNPALPGLPYVKGEVANALAAHREARKVKT